MHQDYEYSDPLAAYCAYLQLDPDKQQLSDFLTIVDSLFPPSSSIYSPDDELLASLLMLDPTLGGGPSAQTKDEGSDQWNAMIADEEIRRIAMTMSPQTLHLNSPALAAHMAGIRAALGSTPNHMAAQLSQDSPYIFTNPDGTMYYDARDASSMFYDHNHVPALHSVAYEGMQRPTTAHRAPPSTPCPVAPHPAAETLPGRAYPRMRPPPPPSPSPSSGIGRVATVPWPPSHVVDPRARSTQAQVRAHAVPVNGPFVGHGMINRVHFTRSDAGPSGLRIKRSGSPILAPFNPSLPRLVPPKVEAPPFRVVEIDAKEFMAGLVHSGRESSPINLCSSSEHGDDQEPDDSDDVEMLGDAYESDEEFEMPDEVEGVEEAHHRAASSTRSSSPVDPKDIIIKGGEPTMDKAVLKELFSTSRHMKLWVMDEKGTIIVFIFGPKAPADRYLKALAPLNPKRPGKFWEAFQKQVFNNSRKASAIAVMFSKLLLVYKDIKYMREVVGFEYDPTMEDKALLEIKHALDDARESGAPITTLLNPWDYFIWTRDNKNGWYALVDATLGSHPNFQVAGQHRSGHLTPPPPSKGKGKEKRPREDDSDDLEETQDPAALSRPNAAIRPRPTIVDINVPSPRGPSYSVPRSSTPMVPQPSGSKLAAPVSLPVTVARSVVPPAGRAKLQPAAGTSAAPQLTPVVTESPTPANDPSSQAVVVDLQSQLLAYRQAQLNLDQFNAQQRQQVVADQQKAREEERAHRHRMETSRADREAAEAEERAASNHKTQFLDLCVRILGSEGVPPDIVEMATNKVREALVTGPPPPRTCLEPLRVPSGVRPLPRRAASVPAHVLVPGSVPSPAPALSAPALALPVAPVVPVVPVAPAAPVASAPVTEPLVLPGTIANATATPARGAERLASATINAASGTNSTTIALQPHVVSPLLGVSLVPGPGSDRVPQSHVPSAPVTASPNFAESGQGCTTPSSMRSIFTSVSGASVPPTILSPASIPGSYLGVGSGNTFSYQTHTPSIPAVSPISSPSFGILPGPGPSSLAGGAATGPVHSFGLGRGHVIVASGVQPPVNAGHHYSVTTHRAVKHEGLESTSNGFVHVNGAMLANLHDAAGA